MDVERYLEIRPAPRAVFDYLPERHARARYLVPTGDGHRTITWAEHAEAIRNVALFAVTRGLRPGQRGAIFAHNRIDWMNAALGMQAAGLVMVPIYPASTADQAAYVLEHSGAKILFVAGADLLGRILLAWPRLEAVEMVVVLDDTRPAAVRADLEEAGERVPSEADLDRRVLHLSQVLAGGEARHGDDPRAFERILHGLEVDQPAQMLYTSGTTGDPKGVPLTHRNVGSNSVDWMRCNAPLLPDDPTDLLWLPMSHIYGFGEACLGNVLGFTTTLAEPSTALGLLPTVRPNVFMSVPAYWEKLAAGALAATDDASAKAALDAATGGRLRFCLSGGAGLSQPVKELYHRCGILIIEGYGLTECSPTLTLNRPDAFRFDSVGKPLPSVELRLADDGEIQARGPNVFGGYHRDPEATKAAFTEDGWFCTGDIGRFTEDGFLQIVDRKKEILVTAGGKNVAPGNIERLFATDPLFSHVVVYGDGKKYLVAGVWLDPVEAAERLASVPEAERNAARVELVQRAVDAANAKLARFEQIKRFSIMDRPLTVEAGLLTSTLKVRRKHVYAALREDFEELYR